MNMDIAKVVLTVIIIFSLVSINNHLVKVDHHLIELVNNIAR